ncbi:CopG family transcriptional regulator [Brevibacterium samyangense]|uniref:CopG family transcriptional regulator n=1 Tax=Brevibacterium samyangense TaxID=366888 RepID=A0ABP5ENE2_9MICO
MAMTLRLTADDEKALAALAERDGVSKHAAAIAAIHEVAARRGHESAVAEASQKARSRYADLLERLGK